MNAKKVFYISAAVLIAVMAISQLQLLFGGEEGRIKRLILRAKKAVEKEDLIFIASIVSYQYSDQYGNDRSSLLYMSKMVFNDYQDMTIGIKSLDLKIEGTSARAEIEALLLAKGTGYQQETNRPEYDIIKCNITFVKEESGWKVLKLEFIQPQNYKYLHAA